MGVLSILARPFARYVLAQRRKWEKKPIEIQEYWFKKLLKSAQNTAFGQDHHFGSIQNYADFKQAVPIRDYEALKPYVERVVAGEANVLWKGKPLYFAKTSGTTSGLKYIPISKESIPFHINAARDALLSYVSETGRSGFFMEFARAAKKQTVLRHRVIHPRPREDNAVDATKS